jgi:predicted transposase/invertase (TIGR01784 family)
MPLYVSISEILADYRANLEANRTLTQEEEELIMNLSAAYLQKRSEWKEEGLQEGLQEGVYKVARNLLRQGMPIELVAQVTELTIDQVRELRDRL